MRTPTFFTIITAITLVACATTKGVLPIGDGINMLSNQDPMAWSGGKLKAEPYIEAAAQRK